MKESRFNFVNKKHPIKEVRYTFSLLTSILLFFTFPIWLIPVIISNLIIGKMFRNFLQKFPRQGLVDKAGFVDVDYNTLDFYNVDLRLKKDEVPQDLFISEEEWAQVGPKDVRIPTFDRTTLAAFLFINKKPTNKWIIVLHGWLQSRYGILYLAKYFYKAGYNVVVYDARNHGSNPDSHTTFGLLESKDLFYVLKYIREKYNKPDQEVEFALVGNSMGASTIMQALINYDLVAMKVKSAVFDCGYSDFSHMVKNLGKYRMNLHWFWYYFGVLFWTYIQDNFKLTNIKFRDKLYGCRKTPILFIHGTKDKTVPISMTKALFKEKVRTENKGRERKKKFSELMIVDDAGHVESILVNYKMYTKKTLDFVDKWFKFSEDEI